MLSVYVSLNTRENGSSKEYQSLRTVTMQFRMDGKQNNLRIQYKVESQIQKKKTFISLVRTLSHYLFNENKSFEKTPTAIQNR